MQLKSLKVDVNIFIVFVWYCPLLRKNKSVNNGLVCQVLIVLLVRNVFAMICRHALTVAPGYLEIDHCLLH